MLEMCEPPLFIILITSYLRRTDASLINPSQEWNNPEGLRWSRSTDLRDGIEIYNTEVSERTLGIAKGIMRTGVAKIWGYEEVIEVSTIIFELHPRVGDSQGQDHHEAQRFTEDSVPAITEASEKLESNASSFKL